MTKFLSAVRRARLASFAALTISSLYCCAQASGHILVPGSTPLTTEVTDKTIGLFEWALDLQFTPQQREQYTDMMIRDWDNPQRRKSTLSFLPTIDKLWASPPETRERVKAQFGAALIGDLRKNQDDEEARWLLTIYENSHSKAALQPTAFASGTPQMVGKWRATTTAATQYKNSYTGAPAPTSGNSFAYEFLPNGEYHSNNLMQVTTYGCTSSIYSDSAGHYRVEGDHLYLQPVRGTVKSQVCGGQPSEKEDSLAAREYLFHIERNDGRDVLVVNGLDGKTRPDYYRRELQ
jgi:hypothetical protein